ncbi:MAG: hypothetical protein WBF71_08460 [Microthrixaceae bacterium]
MTESYRPRWKRWLALGAVTLVILGGLFVWRVSPLPSATWTVTEILVDGKAVDPLGSTIETGLGLVTFHGCNFISEQAGGLPWRPRFISTSTTEIHCLGANRDLDVSWTRLVGSSVTFDGAWRKTATIRGSSVEMRITRN